MTQPTCKSFTEDQWAEICRQVQLSGTAMIQVTPDGAVSVIPYEDWYNPDHQPQQTKGER